MSFQPSADSFGICLLGLRISLWHSRQANDAVASAFLAKIIKFFRVAMNLYVPIFQGLDARGGRKL